MRNLGQNHFHDIQNDCNKTFSRTPENVTRQEHDDKDDITFLDTTSTILEEEKTADAATAMKKEMTGKIRNWPRPCGCAFQRR